MNKKYMRYITILLLAIILTCHSRTTLAANCEYCFEKIADNQIYCEECRLKFTRDVSDLKSNEEQIVNTINSLRKEYNVTLMELIQHYLDMGNQLRLKKARKEQKALNKVPQPDYLTLKKHTVNVFPSKNIEDANILFQDGQMYRNKMNLMTRETKLITAVKRFKKIIDDYPESDMVDDAAYELAEIYEGRYFKDYESSADYYVKCYEYNPNTDKPAHYMAARVYDMHLKDIVKAIKNYELVLKTCDDEEYLKTAKSRIEELKR